MPAPTEAGAADGSPFISDPAVLRGRRTLKWRTGDEPDRLCLGVAEMDVRTPPFLRDALVGAVEHGETGYGLCAEQEAACAAYLRDQHGATVAAVRCTTDVLAGLRTVMGLELAPGCPVIVETPVYGDLFTVVREAGLQPLAVPLLRDAHGYRHDWAALDAAGAAGARAWILCQPHNPVGRAWTEEEQAAAVALADRHELLLLANEVHLPLGLHRQPPSAYADPGIHRVRSFGFTSASKAFNVAGLKSATLYASERAAETLTGIPQGMLGRPGSFGTIATVACYEHGVPWLTELRDDLAGRVAQVLDGLRKLPLVAEAPEPEATYLVWAEFPRDDHAARFAAALRSAAVHVLPGEVFGGDRFARCFRINAAAHPAVLEETFARLRAVL
ncbi:aminotransferase [Streptomyces sp. Ru73]|uniref:aminotransferase class I/II-fold pyridoxal phosphate-dependent enzyme n=1 Tax=Streptomyces sp. Ru73 TaxID=2080748 RepID=UPI000CDDBD74|nr:aminotransferase class I/II-fold pyridoxal phosphate-dependent enzyme [Streptomyces sp. Ru73]POX37631.1 aminotransferase [Streptomyces sp. Ru73]